ncbi:MAG: hypothetical protein R3F59_20860 [Myxococcota bacterium]
MTARAPLALLVLGGCELTLAVPPLDSAPASLQRVCDGALLSVPVRDVAEGHAVVAAVRGRLGGDVRYEPAKGVVSRGPGPACGYATVQQAVRDEDAFREALLTVDPGFATVGSLVDACPCRMGVAHQAASKEAPRLW